MYIVNPLLIYIILYYTEDMYLDNHNNNNKN